VLMSSVRVFSSGQENGRTDSTSKWGENEKRISVALHDGGFMVMRLGGHATRETGDAESSREHNQRETGRCSELLLLRRNPFDPFQPLLQCVLVFQQ